MNTADVLKSYLVSLGFNVDTSSLNQFQRAMTSASDGVEGFTAKSMSGFAKAAIGFTSFIVTVNAGITKYISSLGQADLQTQIFARRMWMSVDAARAYQGSMNALGASLEDLYLSPELMQRYLSLRNQALGMQMNDKDYESAMKGVRDMTFEFQRLRLEGSYALQWIGYYLTKYIDPVLKGSGLSLKGINDLIQQKMPEWTQKVAQIASWFVRLGVAAWDARGALAAIMAIMMAPSLVSMATNPVFLMIAGLTALLLLMDDFKTYEKHDGSKTLFDWKWLDNIGDKLSKAGLSFNAFKGDLKDIAQSAGELGKTLGDLMKTLGVKGGFAEILEKGIIATLKTLDGLLKSINADLKTLNNDLNGKPRPALPDNVTIPGTNIHPNTGKDMQKEAQKIKDFFAGVRNFLGNMGTSLFHSGISPMSYNPQPSSSGIALMSNETDANAPWSKRIYDALSIYLPQIASALGVTAKENGSGQSQLSLMDFSKKLGDLTSGQSGASWVNYSPWQAMYGGNTKTNHSTQVDARSTFNIYGAKDPNTTAKVVNTSQTQAITRHFKGVQA